MKALQKSAFVLEEDQSARGSVSPHEVRLLGPVDAEEQLGGLEVAQVLHAVRAGVLVVVPSFPVVAETVRVFHTQIEALAPHRSPSPTRSWEQHLSHGTVYPDTHFHTSPTLSSENLQDTCETSKKKEFRNPDSPQLLVLI